jgi:hypothetical protein
MRYAFSPFLICIICVASPAAEIASGEKTELHKIDIKSLDFYTFFDLLNKSERIVVAEIGRSKDGTPVLNVKQTLKSPAKDPGYIAPEKYKRAEDLLKDQKTAATAAKASTSTSTGTSTGTKAPVAPATPTPAVPDLETIHVLLDQGIPLPKEGTQAIFFLWDRQTPNGAEPTYRLAHPQCVYDLDLLPQVRAGISRPRGVADGRYLRDWDREMARRARQREADKALDQAKGGEVVMGLRAVATRPRLSVRHDNSFSITARIENSHSKDQAIYEGPVGGFGVRIRPKNGGAGSSIVLRTSMQGEVAGVDNAVLGIVDATDFAIVPKEASLSKELFFDVKTFPTLASLNGEYLVSIVYSSSFDGNGLDVGSPVWTGTLLSEEVALEFNGPETPAPSK